MFTAIRKSLTLFCKTSVLLLGFSVTHVFAQSTPIELATLDILAETLESKGDGEGLTENELVASVTALLGTENPFVDLASANPTLSDGYAGGQFSNLADERIYISINTHSTAADITHTDTTSVSLNGETIEIVFRDFANDISVSLQGVTIIFDGAAGSLQVPISYLYTAVPDENIWIISSSNSGTVNDGLVFSGAHTLIGGSGNDDFTLEAGANFSGSINGGTGEDSFTLNGDGSVNGGGELCPSDSGSSVTLSTGSELEGDANCRSVTGFDSPREWVITPGDDTISIGDPTPVYVVEGPFEISTNDNSGGGSFSFFSLLMLSIVLLIGRRRYPS